MGVTAAAAEEAAAVVAVVTAVVMLRSDRLPNSTRRIAIRTTSSYRCGMGGLGATPKRKQDRLATLPSRRSLQTTPVGP